MGAQWFILSELHLSSVIVFPESNQKKILGYGRQNMIWKATEIAFHSVW